MVFGHLTVTAAGHRLLRRPLPQVAVLPLGLLILGAYLPDLVDKSTNLLVGLSGRGYGHSLVIQAALFAPALLLLRRWRIQVFSLALGAAIHLLEDWVDAAVALAPLLGSIPLAPRWDWFESLRRFYLEGGPQVWLELASFGYWIVVGVRLATRPRNLSAAKQAA